MSNLLYTREEFPLAIESARLLMKKEEEAVKGIQETLKRASKKFGGNKAALKENYVVKSGDEPRPLEYCIRKIKKGLAEKKNRILQLKKMISKLEAVESMLDELGHE
jgi:hypothetical protein